MGLSRGNFLKYPRTPHLFGSSGTSDDKRMGQQDSDQFLSDPSLIVEEKLDGTNVGIHLADGDLILQCRGHEITAGMHPQYDLFKQWASAQRSVFESILGERYVMYGEWLYARHCIHYQELPHYFFEFDMLDKVMGEFLSLDRRMSLLSGTGIPTVPILHRGVLSTSALNGLVSRSQFGARFEHPVNGQIDNRMEGLYLRTESNGFVTARAKWVRPEFVDKIKLSQHWQYQKMVPNELADDAKLW